MNFVDESSAETAEGFVRSLLLVVMRFLCWDKEAGTGGSITSVMVRRVVGEASIRAAVRACPMKPAPPVMRMFSSWVWVVVAILVLDY